MNTFHGHPATEVMIKILDLPEEQLWRILDSVADITVAGSTERTVLGIDRDENVVICRGPCRFTHAQAAIIFSDASMAKLARQGRSEQGHVRTRCDGRSVHIFSGPRAPVITNRHPYQKSDGEPV